MAKRICLTLAIVLVFVASSLFGQTKVSKYVVTGSVVDSITQKAIGYATIAIRDDSSQIVNAAAADASGKFSSKIAKPGKYKVEVSFMGYGSKSVDVNLKDNEKVDIGKVLLTEGLVVDAVNVVVQKQLITASPDKIAYNLEADPEAATSTTFEILRKVPMISIDGEENVKLNGESNYKVLVNGKTSSMMSKNFKDVIKSMPANSIKNIEVITNPPTKYDAEGIGGIINIITNKRSVSGYNGNLNMGATNMGSVNGSGYVAAQLGKFSISASMYGGRFINKGMTSESETENFTSQESHYSLMEGSSGKSTNKFGNISLEASYEIDSLNLITLSGWGYLGRYGSLSTSNTRYWNTDMGLTREFDNITDLNDGGGSGSGSINYQKSFKKPDQTLTFSYNLDANPRMTEYTSKINGILNYDSYEQYSHNSASGMEHTAQVDYYDPVNEKHQYEAGLKYILRKNVSNTDVQDIDPVTGEGVENNTKINDLDYNQHIGSLYGGYVFKHKKFTAKAGMRGELTINTGVSKSIKGDQKFSSDPLFNVVPYVNLSYMLNKGQNVVLSYTQRIQRPGIWHLNPYVNDMDPMNISTGNPDLKSVVSNSVSANYRKSAQSWNLFLNATANFSNKSIEQITRINEDGVKFTTYDNIGINNNYRLNMSFSYRLGIKLNVYANGGVSYIDIKSKENNLANSGFSYQGSIGGGVKLWKESTLNVGGGAYSSSVNLQGSGSTYFYHSIGLSQKFFKQTFTVSVYANNPFKRYMSSTSTRSDEYFNSVYSYRYEMRQFSLNLGYRFGKMNAQVKKTRRSINNDDKLAGGSSSGGTGGTN